MNHFSWLFWLDTVYDVNVKCREIKVGNNDQKGFCEELELKVGPGLDPSKTKKLLNPDASC